MQTSPAATPLQYMRWWKLGGYALIAAVIYFSLTPRAPQIDMQQGDKLGHLLAYGSLMFWFAQVELAKRLRWAIGFVLLGITLEFLQGMTSYRSFDAFDMLANTTGVVLGWLCALPPQARLFLRLERLFLRPRQPD